MKDSFGHSKNSSRQCWWITASDTNPDRAWNWSIFFGNPKESDDRMDWGGPDWIKSTRSFPNIENMRKGDIVVAYQATKGIVGLTKLASNGRQSESGGPFDMFDLAGSSKLWLEKPVPFHSISALPGARRTIEAVPVKATGTVFAVKPQGYEQLCRLILAFNPSLEKPLARFLLR